jgi:NADPH:quinone reductase-like Zn-dependent oxidoreductase
MGMLPGYPDGVGPLGVECAGRVSAVGSEVTRFACGDEVLAIAPDSLATHLLADERLVVRRPGQLDWEEAATLPAESNPS